MPRNLRSAVRAAMLIGVAAAAPVVAQTAAAPATEAVPSGQTALLSLFQAWRAFVRPPMHGDVPDYGEAAMAAKAAALPAWRARLAAIDTRDWPPAARNDWRLIEAEMNGFDFNMRVLRPWARDPGFYATVFGEESDVPAHEGQSADPAIDLFRFDYPLSRADDRHLTSLVGGIPALLTAARVHLAASDAADLWRYGGAAFRQQGEVLAALEAGTLVMRTLAGEKHASLAGASPQLRRAVQAARTSTNAFAGWIAAEAPKKTGPSGVGKANYDWYMRHVSLTPYSWDEQVVLVQRELDRALTSLRLEELRNRTAPPIVAIDDPATFDAMAIARTRRFNDFLIASGLVPDRPYFRAALEAQSSRYVAPDKRNFFSHVTALDPLPLLSHSTHWIELARLKYEPRTSQIRRTAPLFNIFADRSEGFATAMEEIVMQAGLYDDLPHGRELVWIMLANRAARGLASLRVQANEIDLAAAGRFHAEWTPRRWSDPDSPLVGFEQLLYLRQPGYGPSYIIGKVQLDALLARASHGADRAGTPFVIGDAFARIIAAGILPPALIADEAFATANR